MAHPAPSRFPPPSLARERRCAHQGGKEGFVDRNLEETRQAPHFLVEPIAQIRIVKKEMFGSLR